MKVLAGITTPVARLGGLATFALPRGTWLGLLLGGLLLSSAGCDSAEVRPGSKAQPKAEPAAAQAAAPTAPAGTATATALRAAAAPHAAQGDIEWGGNITWLSYEQGLAEAKRSKKPLCVVVYADWCPRCRELAQAFRDPKLEALAKRVVMVRHNADQPGAWLETAPLAQHGKYVPRVFFFDSQGGFAANITSGHPRYPFFYAANAPEALQQSLAAALKLSS